MAPTLKRSLTGIRASGNLHLGNYLGTIRPAIAKQNDYECIYFVADMHSLTTNKEPKLLRQYTLDIVAAWIALGLDTKRNIIFRQSDIPMVTEFAWYLSCCIGFGFLEKGHAFKDALAENRDVNHGVFAYPVLMAADILMYDPDIVPVGKDQKQHVEMARDMAGAFNAAYGAEVIKLPEVVIDEKVQSIPGLDGRKMSKSYGNEIPLFCDAATLKKKVMSIKTDSSGVHEAKQLRLTLLGDLFAHFASAEQFNDLEKRLAQGGMGWGHAKEELYQVIDAAIAAPRERYNKIRADEQYLNSVLQEGSERGFAIAEGVLNRLRKAVGFRPCPYLISRAK